MTLHKLNTVKVQPFYKALGNIQFNDTEEMETPHSLNELQMLEKYSYFIQNIILFNQEVRNDTSICLLMTKFTKYLKGIIPVKECCLLFYDELKKELIPVINDKNSKISAVMNSFYREGLFLETFLNKKTVSIPELESYNSEGPKLYYLVFPVYDEKKNYGILSILTSLDESSITELEKKNISIYLNILLGKIEKHNLIEKLNNTYEELQTYQAKLSNDFRLSAIGEMTEGIVEDIITPLQVINSSIDLLSTELQNNSEVNQIKSQVDKINTLVNRLVKFADVNLKDIKIQSCNLNEIIKDYFYLVKSTLENANLEYILDIDKDLPPILSHPNYIYQLLTNIFSLIKSYKTKKGGLIIQTRYKNSNVYLRIISTVGIEKLKNMNDKNASINVSKNIIKNLMKKHEGQLEFDSFENNGAALVLIFPLRRKIRK